MTKLYDFSTAKICQKNNSIATFSFEPWIINTTHIDHMNFVKRKNKPHTSFLSRKIARKTDLKNASWIGKNV